MITWGGRVLGWCSELNLMGLFAFFRRRVWGYRCSQVIAITKYSI